MCYLYNLHPNHTVLHMLSGSVTYTNWLQYAIAVISMSLKKRHLNDHTSPCHPPPQMERGLGKRVGMEGNFLHLSLSPFPLTNFLKPSFDNSTFLKPFSINFYLSQSTAWESIFYVGFHESKNSWENDSRYIPLYRTPLMPPIILTWFFSTVAATI